MTASDNFPISTGRHVHHPKDIGMHGHFSNTPAFSDHDNTLQHELEAALARMVTVLRNPSWHPDKQAADEAAALDAVRLPRKRVARQVPTDVLAQVITTGSHKNDDAYVSQHAELTGHWQ